MFGSTAPNPYDTIVSTSTSENLTSENWELILNLCDKVSEEGPEGAHNVILALLKRLAHRNANVQLYTLSLAEALAKNCGINVWRELASRAWTQALEKLVLDRNTHDKVRKRSLTLLAEWADEFRADESLSIIAECLEGLERKGYKPPAPESEPVPDVDDERRRLEEEELQRVLEISVQDKGGRSAWVGGYGAEASASGSGRQRTPSPKPVQPTGGYVPYQQTAAQPVPYQAQQTPASPVSRTPPTSATASMGIVTRVRALHPFTPTEPGELAFQKDDIIKVVDRGYKDWWRGQLRGRTGIFPVNYVEPLPEPTEDELAKEAMEEARIFSEAVNVEKLLQMLKALEQDGAGEEGGLADNEEIQDLYRSCMALRPKIVKLIDKYSQKRADLVSMNETFVRARTIFDRMMEESLARHTGVYEQPSGYGPRAAPYGYPAAQFPTPVAYDYPQQYAPPPQHQQTPPAQGYGYGPQGQGMGPVPYPAVQAQQQGVHHQGTPQPVQQQQQPVHQQNVPIHQQNAQPVHQQNAQPIQHQQSVVAQPVHQQSPQPIHQQNAQPIQHQQSVVAQPVHQQSPQPVHQQNAQPIQHQQSAVAQPVHQQSPQPTVATQPIQHQQSFTAQPVHQQTPQPTTQPSQSTTESQPQQQTGPPYIYSPNATYADPNVQAWAQYYAQGGKEKAGAVYFVSVPGVTDDDATPPAVVQPQQQQGQPQQQQQQQQVQEEQNEQPLPDPYAQNQPQEQGGLPDPYAQLSQPQQGFTRSESAHAGYAQPQQGFTRSDSSHAQQGGGYQLSDPGHAQPQGYQLSDRPVSSYYPSPNGGAGDIGMGVGNSSTTSLDRAPASGAGGGASKPSWLLPKPGGGMMSRLGHGGDGLEGQA